MKFHITKRNLKSLVVIQYMLLHNFASNEEILLQILSEVVVFLEI